MRALLVYLATVPLFASCTVVFHADQHDVHKTTLSGGVEEVIVHRRGDRTRWYAKLKYEATYSAQGWDYLHVETNPSVTDEEQAYFAGFIEGHVTHNAIYKFWYNVVSQYCNKREKFCEKVNEYLDKNLEWIRKTVESQHTWNDPFWHQVDLFDRQMQGISEGYNFQTVGEKLTFRDIIWLNYMNEIETLTIPFNGSVLPLGVEGNTRCSVLIKLLPGFQDLLVSHVTWLGFHYMVRIIKKYDFNFQTIVNNGSRIAGSSMTMSSYPGAITSVDDYYVIKSGLVVLETTIDNNNHSLWELLQPTEQVLETMRSMVANRLASDGKEWSQVFSRYNNGLCNNQWMVVDMKKFVPGQCPTRGTLWISEQSPGLVMSKDQTDILVGQFYWPSYNIPAFREIFQRMGNDQLVEKYGDWFSYMSTPRAKIFRRDQSKVKDINSMMELMRSNNYKKDVYSSCNCTPPYSASSAIAARGDLNPQNGTYPFPAIGHRNYGAIDAKVTNYSLSQRLQFYAVCGPAEGSGLPAFRWSSTQLQGFPHIGQPDQFNFTPVLHSWL